jgi:hypothetical protein
MILLSAKNPLYGFLYQKHACIRENPRNLLYTPGFMMLIHTPVTRRRKQTPWRFTANSLNMKI